MRSRCCGKLRNNAEDETHVSALTFYRIDPAGRMRRFYVIDLQPDLFGQRSLIREWGRIGSPGPMRIATCPNENAARSRLPATRVPWSVVATARSLEAGHRPFRADRPQNGHVRLAAGTAGALAQESPDRLFGAFYRRRSASCGRVGPLAPPPGVFEPR